MIAAEILAELWRSKILVRLTDDGVNLAVPAGRLTPEQRQRVLAHKPELVAFLHAARETTEQLLEAAMLACDHWNDGPAAREEMRRWCLEQPQHLHADLRDNLLSHYGGQSRDGLLVGADEPALFFSAPAAQQPALSHQRLASA